MTILSVSLMQNSFAKGHKKERQAYFIMLFITHCNQRKTYLSCVPCTVEVLDVLLYDAQHWLLFGNFSLNLT